MKFTTADFHVHYFIEMGSIGLLQSADIVDSVGIFEAEIHLTRLPDLLRQTKCFTRNCCPPMPRVGFLKARRQNVRERPCREMAEGGLQRAFPSSACQKSIHCLDRVPFRQPVSR